MSAFRATTSSTVNREHNFSNVGILAAELTNRYEDGFLPGPGGWLNQDHFYAMLITEGLAAKRERQRIEDRKAAAEAKMRARRRH